MGVAGLDRQLATARHGVACVEDEVEYDLLQLALSMESHPDNIAAALFGGLNFSWLEETGRAGTMKLAVHPEIVPVVAIPGDAVATSKARTALPASR